MNGGPINWRELFASAAGRSSRLHFWIGAGLLLALTAFYDTVTEGPMKLLTFWFVYPALLASGACVIAKRLHDRGRSGWWAALVLTALIFAWPNSNGARVLLAAPVLIWALVELGLLPGETGANRFGQRPAEEAA
jgi:uncharacterized membrane protein YhaH (DUF805 family)